MLPTSVSNRPKTAKCYESLSQIIPGGVNSPVRAFKQVELEPPLIVDRAAGDLVYDLDGNSYIDYCGSWGPLIHGHAEPTIIAAVQKRVALGTSFGITSAIEEKLARLVIKFMPSIEKVRFVSSGTEATMSAARLARGYTHRDLIVKFVGNYHGHADFFLVQAGSGVFGLTPTSSSAGIPDESVCHTVCLPYNDLETCRQFLLDPEQKNRIAAVIIEPIAGNMGCVPATQSFLNMLREVTHKIGALLIFDEVITGFRVGLGGAQALYKITPDLTCLGKIVGGGFPAAAFGGNAEIMNFLAPLGPVYQAGTLSGNPVAMEAGYQTLLLLDRPHFYEELKQKTDLLTQPLKKWIEKSQAALCLQQVGSMFTLFFGRRSVDNMEEAKQLDIKAFAHFFRFLFNQKVYIPPSQYETCFVSMAHSKDHLQHTAELVTDYLKRNYP